MPRHSVFVFVLAIASSAACATPSAGVNFDQSALVRPSTSGLSHEEREWLAAGKPEDMVNVDHLGLGEPTAAAIIVDEVGYGFRSATGGDQAANISQQSINNCARQGQDCVDDDDFLLDWTHVN